MLQSAKHLQFSVLAGLATVFGLTITFAGAQTAMIPGIVQSFTMNTPNDILEGPFAGAEFDLAGYMNHPCYTITGKEVQECADQGITEPLKTYLDNGSLLSYVSSRGLLAGQNPQVIRDGMPVTPSYEAPAAAVTEPTTSTVTLTLQPTTTVINDSVDTEADFANLRLARSNKLWDICIRQDATRDNAAICFQRNMHILMRLDTPLNEQTVQ